MRLHTPVATDDGATITGLVRSEVVVNERDLRPVAGRPQPHRLRGRRPRRPRQRDDRPRRRRPAAAGRAARPMALRAARGGRRDRRRSDPRVPGGRVRAAQALRHRLRGEGPRARRPRAGRGPRHGLADEVRREAPSWGCRRAPSTTPSPGACRRAGASCARSSTTAYNRDERDRRAFDGIMSHVAGGGRGSFNTPVRPAVARRAPVPEQALPERHLPVHRRRPARPRDGHAGRPALGHPARPHAEGLLHELVLRVLGPGGVAHPHHPSTARRTRR